MSEREIRRRNLLNIRKSQEQERDTARKFGGRTVPGSGNTVWAKNDVRTTTESIECKLTVKPSFSLKLADLEKAEFNAMADGRDMIFKITFAGGSKPKNYIVISEDDYLERMRQMNGAKAANRAAERME